jgi:hypothetical protein
VDAKGGEEHGKKKLTERNAECERDSNRENQYQPTKQSSATVVKRLRQLSLDIK